MLVRFTAIGIHTHKTVLASLSSRRKQALIEACFVNLTEFRQPLRVQIHLEMPRILVQLGHIQRT